MNNKLTGEVRLESLSPARSKPIIDEIDTVLAKHYGFTDEELDFIINYDIKYRLGAKRGERSRAVFIPRWNGSASPSCCAVVSPSSGCLRYINGMRLKPELQPAFDDGRLLVFSSFEQKEKRITSALAAGRNRYLASLSTEVFIAHAAPASRTLALCRELANANKPLLTIDDPANQPLLDLGAKSAAPPIRKADS